MPLLGDIYSAGQTFHSLDLPEGSLDLFVRIKGKAHAAFRCAARSLPSGEGALLTAAVVLVPDLLFYRGQNRLWGSVLGLRLTNPGAAWLRVVSCTVEGVGLGPADAAVSLPGTWLAPGQSLPLPCAVQQSVDQALQCGPDGRSSFSVLLRAAEGPVERGVRAEGAFRCRGVREAAVLSFLDHDGTPPQRHCSATAAPQTGCD